MHNTIIQDGQSNTTVHNTRQIGLILELLPQHHLHIYIAVIILTTSFELTPIADPNPVPAPRCKTRAREHSEKTAETAPVSAAARTVPSTRATGGCCQRYHRLQPHGPAYVPVFVFVFVGPRHLHSLLVHLRFHLHFRFLRSPPRRLHQPVPACLAKRPHTAARTRSAQSAALRCRLVRRWRGGIRM